MKSDFFEFWHWLTADEVHEKLAVSTEGLSSAEAAISLERYGSNMIKGERRVNPMQLFFQQLQHVLIIILLVATGLSAFLGHGLEALAIVVIVVFAVLLGFIQEFRAEKAIESLRMMAAPLARVRRDGQEVFINATDLVPGYRRNMVFAGTMISYGRASAIVVSTGMQAEFGGIAAMLQAVGTEKTPLLKNLDNVGSALACVALLIVLVIVVLGLFRGQSFIDKLIFGMTMAFISLVLIQFFKGYNFRSETRSLLKCPFASRGLNLAIGWELLMLASIIYVPVFRKTFGTFLLTPQA